MQPLQPGDSRLDSLRGLAQVLIFDSPRSCSYTYTYKGESSIIKLKIKKRENAALIKIRTVSSFTRSEDVGTAYGLPNSSSEPVKRGNSLASGSWSLPRWNAKIPEKMYRTIEVDLEASISRSSSIRMRSVEISGLLSQGPPGASEPPIQEFFFDLLQTQPLARRWKQQGVIVDVSVDNIIFLSAVEDKNPDFPQAGWWGLLWQGIDRHYL